MTNILPQSHLDLLDNPVVVMLATLMPDGFPQVTPVWCSHHDDQIWVNSSPGRQKDENMRQDDRVNIAVTDPENPYRWLEVRGNVVEIVDDQEEAWAHINSLAKMYIDKDVYPFATPDKEKRAIYKIKPFKANTGG